MRYFMYFIAFITEEKVSLFLSRLVASPGKQLE